MILWVIYDYYKASDGGADTSLDSVKFTVPNANNLSINLGTAGGAGGSGTTQTFGGTGYLEIVEIMENIPTFVYYDLKKNELFTTARRINTDIFDDVCFIGKL